MNMKGYRISYNRNCIGGGEGKVNTKTICRQKGEVRIMDIPRHCIIGNHLNKRSF